VALARYAPVLARYAAALAGVVVMTLIIAVTLSVTGVQKLSILYLIVVLAAATKLGRGPAIFASLAAFLIYDWSFTEPYHEFTIQDPNEWISLVLFLITAVIASELAANERMRALQAERREREAVVLFDALRLMSGADLDAALRALAERVRTELHAAAVGIDLFIVGDPRAATAGEAEPASLIARSGPDRTELMEPGHAPTATRRGSTGRWVRIVPPQRAPAFEAMGRWRRYVVPMRVGDRGVGRIVLVRSAEQSHFGQLEDRFLGVIASQLALLVQRVESERSASEAELLRQASELKTAVLNAVSHDLRTPLASIIASAGSLAQHDVPWSEEDRDAFVTAIEQEAGRLDRIVGNLLDLSRIESGVLRPDLALHDVGTLIRDVVARIEARTTGHPILVDVPDDLAPVPLDAVEIDQVLSNLIENAIKYAPAGTSVEVAARRSDDEIVVSVADHGPGIPPEEIDRLFEPFYRIRGTARGRSGLGLGLAVSKGLIQAHGGRISVERREGGGARFAFALRAAAGAEPASPRVSVGA
jgi:two-component system, OmpR family, sensor histidine kinase KdpD